MAKGSAISVDSPFLSFLSSRSDARRHQGAPMWGAALRPQVRLICHEKWADNSYRRREGACERQFRNFWNGEKMLKLRYLIGKRTKCVNI